MGKSQIRTLFSIIRNLMSKIYLYVWGLGLGVLGFGVGGVVGKLVGCTYTHLVKIYTFNSSKYFFYLTTGCCFPMS